jgi:predicted nucleotidyltransferase
MKHMTLTRPRKLVARGMTKYRERALERVKDIVLAGLEGCGAVVYLVGSCASGTAVRTSDIAIDPSETLPSGTLVRIREFLEESTVPYFIDVIDLGAVDAESRTRLLKGTISWTS